MQRGGGIGGRSHLLLALSFVACLVVIRPLVTHLMRKETPLLLLIETPPTFGRSAHFFQK